MMFVDASAMVAIITGEPEGDLLLDRLEAAQDYFTSPLAVFETVLAVARKLRTTQEEAHRIVMRFTERARIPVRPIAAEAAAAAIDAHGRYGKGNHPAKLNMGDCFAYACAKVSGAELLYKGADFDATDLATL